MKIGRFTTVNGREAILFREEKLEDYIFSQLMNIQPDEYPDKFYKEYIIKKEFPITIYQNRRIIFLNPLPFKLV